MTEIAVVGVSVCGGVVCCVQTITNRKRHASGLLRKSAKQMLESMTVVGVA